MDDGKDVFVHFSAIRGEGFNPSEGDEMNVKSLKVPKVPQAANVKVIR